MWFIMLVKSYINVKVDLSSYAAKADFKNISHVDTSSFALNKFS